MSRGIGKLINSHGKVSDCLRKVSYGLGKMSDSLGRVSDGFRNVSDGLGKDLSQFKFFLGLSQTVFFSFGTI